MPVVLSTGQPRPKSACPSILFDQNFHGQLIQLFNIENYCIYFNYWNTLMLCHTLSKIGLKSVDVSKKMLDKLQTMQTLTRCSI